jgi:hypothetical protein
LHPTQHAPNSRGRRISLSSSEPSTEKKTDSRIVGNSRGIFTNQLMRRIRILGSQQNSREYLYEALCGIEMGQSGEERLPSRETTPNRTRGYISSPPSWIHQPHEPSV